MAKARDIAALAGLAGLAFANRDKLFGSKGPSATAAEEEASKARMDAQKNAVSGNRVTNESSLTGTTKNDSNVAKNIGFGGGDYSDKNLKRVDFEVKPKPVTAKPVTAKPVTANPVVSGQKKNIVSKKQLQDYKNKFGQDKTLTDYMNSQRASANKPIKPVSLPASYRHGGAIKGMASGGMTASRRGDGIATKGKTRGKIC